MGVQGVILFFVSLLLEFIFEVEYDIYAHVWSFWTLRVLYQECSTRGRDEEEAKCPFTSWTELLIVPTWYQFSIGVDDAGLDEFIVLEVQFVR